MKKRRGSSFDLWTNDCEAPTLVEKLLKRSKLTLEEALERTFFLGRVEFVGYKRVVRIEPALSADKIKKRLKSEEFCLSCLNQKEWHDLDCREGPWANL